MRRGRQPHDRIDHGAGSPEAAHLEWVVRQQPNRADPELGEHGGRLGVVARVDRQAEGDVGVDRVGAAVLRHIGAQLVDEPDAAAFVPGRVDEDAAPFSGDGAQRELQLDAAIAAQRSECVAREALRVEPHEHVLAVADVAMDHRDVHVAGGLFERPDLEHAVRGGQGYADGLRSDHGRRLPRSATGQTFR